MAKDYNVAKLIPGRSLEFVNQGVLGALAKSCSRKYRVLRDYASPLTAEALSSITGLPAMNSAHPTHSNMLVSGYKFSEAENGIEWIVEVVYSSSSFSSPINKVPRGQAEQSRGWSTQDMQVDLTHAAASPFAAVRNSAGDPFESVPQIPMACPVFKREIKSNTGPGGLIQLSGTINNTSITIDGVTIAAHCGRLSVAVEKLYLDADGYAYKFTLEVAVMANIIPKDGGGFEDIGWDRAFVQAGFNYLDAAGNKLTAMEQDDKTNQLRQRQTPVLLDEGGHLVLDDIPRTKKVQAIRAANWGDIFAEGSTP